MIIGKQYGIHSLSRLIDVLTTMRSAIVRLTIGERPESRNERGCGFFITPQLIVTPAFFYHPHGSHDRGKPPSFILAECFRDGEPVWSHRVTAPVEFLQSTTNLTPPEWTQNGRALLALLRVPRRAAAADAVLPLAFDAQQEGDFVTVVQFPRGDNQHGVSFGALQSVGKAVLQYDANTDVGSSGAPVLDVNWRIVAMHFGSDRKRTVNQGLSRGAIVDVLRHSRYWNEIKDYHRIADVGAAAAHIAVAAELPEPEENPLVTATPKEPNTLVRAALTASIERASLSDSEAATLQPLIIDPNAERWVLKASERARILSTAGPLEKLKDVPRYPAREGDAAQRAIEQILAGPPYELETYDEETLASWIPVARWFAGVHPEIPTPAAVTRVLERQRVRSRLQAIAGDDFRGRETELAQLRRWWKGAPRPLSLTGIGGIGKSALVARFAQQLPKDTLLLWLDFDRADLAPDDAPSVLAAISDQATVQLDGLERPNIDATGWKRSANTLGRRLSKALPPKASVLLVLDSFEAAQYAVRYQELWPVLESIAAALPRLRLVVTGRAPVPELKLGGKKAQRIHLEGLERDDARTWLREHGVTRAPILNRVLDIASGIPLILRLALRLVERGGTLQDLPKRLPDEVVAGFLYDRILDRVQNPAFKPIATAALALRRLTPEMVQPVLGGLVDLPAGEVSSWFPELARELSLVEGTDVLHLRPEVRAAALTLVEKDRPDLVKDVEQRATRWYAEQDTSDPEIAAELVYHRLRLGDRKGANEAWRDGCGRFLTDAADELPPPSRAWLRSRLGGANLRSVETRYGYEVEAAERIRDARSRGQTRLVAEILGEQPTRTGASPLVFQEAYEQWAGGDTKRAWEILKNAGDAPGFVGRDRNLLRALLLAERGDAPKADDLLSSLEQEHQWYDRPSPALHALAVQAARIQLTASVEDECLLRLQTRGRKSGLAKSGLAPADILLPRFSIAIALTQFLALESSYKLTNVAASDQMAIASLIESARTPFDVRETGASRERLLSAWSEGTSWALAHGHEGRWSGKGAKTTLESRLRERAWRRWWFASSFNFLQDAYDLATHLEPTALAAGIVGTAALFAAPIRLSGFHFVQLVGQKSTLADEIAGSVASRQMLRIKADRWPVIRGTLKLGVDPDLDWDKLVRLDHSSALGNVATYTGELSSLPLSARSIVIHLMTPKPLEQLVHELAGYSSSSA